MFAIEIEFLMGRALLTQIGARDLPEWPPHPQRLFSALASAQFELNLGAAGEAALAWLENLPPPEICADLQPSYRQTHCHWVPVNDEALRPDKGDCDFRHPLERRNRQERFFPAVIPSDPIVAFQWPKAEGLEAHRKLLADLVENVSYLGHSASPVRACLRDRIATPTLRPSAQGDRMIRVPGPGRLQRLVNVHRLRLDDATIQPPMGRVECYAAVTNTPQSLFSTQPITLAFSKGPRLALDSTIPLMQHFRDAVLSRMDTPAPACLSGHDSDGTVTRQQHLAFVPLAFVGSKHADGSLKGVALVLPKEAGADIRRSLLSAVSDPWKLHLGPLGNISIQPTSNDSAELRSLRFARYTELSSSWATITPIVLDRHPKPNRLAEEIIAASCIRSGLPAPIEVRTGVASALYGAPRSKDFHGSCKQTAGRVMTHALIRFAEKVRGPVLLGAGRFMGLGVCLPFDRQVRR
jgi:CRISPR-associated protein Csb2